MNSFGILVATVFEGWGVMVVEGILLNKPPYEWLGSTVKTSHLSQSWVLHTKS